MVRPNPAFFALAVAALAAIPAHARNDYYFGDSDLEQGNFQLLAGDTPNDHKPYYCGDDGLCRDSNGPGWAERLTPGLSAAFAVPTPRGSLNFAVSGAHMTDRGDDALPVATGVTRQIAQFEALLGSATIRLSSDDRFFIHAGTNDMLRLLDGEAADTVRSDIVTAAADHVRMLAADGARTIVVARVQPVQFLPFLADDIYAPLRDVAAQFVSATNKDLAATMEALRRALPTGTRVILVDQTAFFDHLRRDFRKLGFTSFDTACYDAVTGTLCSTDAAEQNRHVFFDGNHFSAAGHILLADWYRATLAAGTGEAARGAALVPNVLLTGGDRMRRETDAARLLMTGADEGALLFGAPVFGTAKSRQGTAPPIRNNQRGGLFGVQLPLRGTGYGALSVGYLEQRATSAGTARFNTREWSLSGTTGMRLGALRFALHGNYAWPRIVDFQRDVGALGLVARGSTRATRYGVGAELAIERSLGLARIAARNRLDYDHVRVSGFSETGADGVSLAYSAQSAHELLLESDTKIGIALVDRASFSLLPYFQLRGRTLLAGKSHDVTSMLLGGLDDRATLRVGSAIGDSFALGGGTEALLGRRLRIGLSYERTISGTERGSEAAAVRIAIHF
ncbi:MAG TPA: SGNH/GDSL hydrolase family protein [Sphingomonas sp.]|nr:SGNH/GDSL hydrolase family protein [Sphingomonas sp.]